jgi:hypothetical protein
MKIKGSETKEVTKILGYEIPSNAKLLGIELSCKFGA